MTGSSDQHPNEDGISIEYFSTDESDIYRPLLRDEEIVASNRSPLHRPVCVNAYHILLPIVLVVAVIAIFFVIITPLHVFPSLDEPHIAAECTEPEQFWWRHLEYNMWAHAATHAATTISAEVYTVSSWWTAITFDSTINIPILPPPLAKNQQLPVVSLRHVRMQNGIVYVHLPRKAPSTTTEVFANKSSNSALWPIGSSRSAYKLKFRHVNRQRLEPDTLKSKHSTNGTSMRRQVISLSSLPAQCHATQLDDNEHVFGRLAFNMNSAVMMQNNVDALANLFRRLKMLHNAVAMDSFYHANVWWTTASQSIMMDTSGKPIDYGNRQQCHLVLDHAYIIQHTVGGNNFYHRIFDYVLQWWSILNDPCFAPLDTLNVMQHTSNISNHCEHLVEYDPQWRRRTLILHNEAAFNEDDGFSAFISDYFLANGSTLPMGASKHLFHIMTTAQLKIFDGAICIRDLHIGIPLQHYHNIHSDLSESSDPNRNEFERHRMNEFIHDIETAAGLHDKQRRIHLLCDGSDRLCHADDHNTVPFNLTGLNLTNSVRPFQWLRYMDWRHQANIKYATLNSESEIKVVADRPRPLSEDETSVMMSLLSKGQMIRPVLFNGTGCGLRLLLAIRTSGFRSWSDCEAMAKAASIAGFNVTVIDLPSERGSSLRLRKLFSFFRSFHVVLTAHGGFGPNLLFMSPGKRALFIEVFPECFQHADSMRLGYHQQIAHHTSVRSIDIGVPCSHRDKHGKLENANTRLAYNTQRVKERIWTDEDYLTGDNLVSSFAPLMTRIYDSFFSLPMHSQFMYPHAIVVIAPPKLL